uniref:Deoxyribonuclease II n=1 Tax=Steinernema glaseri TaxID=37863 RepID=A0A1I7YXH8_9BILA
MREALLFLLAVAAAAAFSCKDQSNKDVDWWFAYKLPKEKASKEMPGLRDGTAFYYLDANNPVFTPSDVSLGEKNQAIAYTLQQFYDSAKDPSIFYVFYNDDTNIDEKLKLFENKTEEDARSSQYGHTKGVSFFNRSSGVWYVHSVPRFPSLNGYHYPGSAKSYGQSMLCISMGYDQLKSVGTQLFYNRPKIYHAHLPKDMAVENEDLAQAVLGKYQKGVLKSSILDLHSKNGVTFRSFAKTGTFAEDLYSELVAPNLRSNLTVETWRRGRIIEPQCSARFVVNDVLEMKVGSIPAFKYTRDHSKLAVSASPHTPYTCIGDINRMYLRRTLYTLENGPHSLLLCISTKPVLGLLRSMIDIVKAQKPSDHLLLIENQTSDGREMMEEVVECACALINKILCVICPTVKYVLQIP